MSSFGSVATVARAALRLAGEDVPPKSEEVLDSVARRFGLDAASLHGAAEIKQGRKVKDLDEMKRIYLGYFDQIASLGRALDALGSEPPGAASEEHVH